MTTPFFETDRRTTMEAIEHAQNIAFAPMVFQASRALRNLGILSALDVSGGATQDEIVARTGLSPYGARVLLEAGLGIGLLTCRAGTYQLTKAGWFILHDRMTITNMDFSHDVCYEGLANLDEALVDGAPRGLRALGEWDTIYQALTHLPARVSQSWYAFDHYYSDDAYATVLPIIERTHPKSVLDIGGNTGRFALQMLRRDPHVHVGILDLPDMAQQAATAVTALGCSDRITLHAVDLLDPQQALPSGYDIVWMSQVLDCFSEEQIVSILTRVRLALSDDARVFIMEPFWDRQRREISAFCLQMTSLYFAGLANGNSQLYHSELFIKLIESAGLVVEEQLDNIGVCQSLLVCRKA